MSLEAHIRELETKHQKLEDQIADMMNHPSVDDLEIKRLKLEKLRSCDGTWCAATAGTITGWVRQDLLWGVYPHERF